MVLTDIVSVVEPLTETKSTCLGQDVTDDVAKTLQLQIHDAEEKMDIIRDSLVLLNNAFKKDGVEELEKVTSLSGEHAKQKAICLILGERIAGKYPSVARKRKKAVK